ncbi:MAG: class I SAM-dependent methyltransferase [Firmicutes bacterium]|nr:class I SAM-dependent methyltransferase [Bacillota bacterium]
MDAYSALAGIYDFFMDELDYKELSGRIIKLTERFGSRPRLLADLGCGTGSLALELSLEGIDVIGIDSSEEMLSGAMEKALERGADILFLEQDIREFELYGTVGCITCLTDTLNYITEPEELMEVFRLVHNYLDYDGLFIFDVNSEYKLKTILGNETFCETREEACYIWESSYFPDEKINEFYMNFFIRRDDGAYERHEEWHYERAYSQKELLDMLCAAKLTPLAVFDGYSDAPPAPDSERLVFVAKKEKPL